MGNTSLRKQLVWETPSKENPSKESTWLRKHEVKGTPGRVNTWYGKYLGWKIPGMENTR